MCKPARRHASVACSRSFNSIEEAYGALYTKSGGEVNMDREATVEYIFNIYYG